MTLERLYLAPILRSRADFWTAIGLLAAWSALAITFIVIGIGFATEGQLAWMAELVLAIWAFANVYDLILALREYRATSPKGSA